MKTIYVSPNGTRNASGSLRDPLLSIEEAAQRADGEVIVLPGTHHQRVAPNNVKGIKIKAAEEDSVTIDGRYSLPGGAFARAGGSKYNSDEWFPCHPYKDEGGKTQRQFKGLGFVWGALLHPQNCQGIEFEGLTFINSRGRGLSNDKCNDMHYSNCHFSGIRNAGFWSRGDNVFLDDCSFLDCGNFAPVSRSPRDQNWGVIFHPKQGMNIIATRCIVGESYAEGVGCSDVVGFKFIDGIIYDCHAMLYYGHYGQKIKLVNTLLYQTDSKKFLRGGKYPSCIVINMETRNFTDRPPADEHSIENCLVLNRGNGVDFWGNQGGGAKTGKLQLSNLTIFGSGPSFHSLTDGSVHTDTVISNVLAWRENGKPIWSGTPLSKNAEFISCITSSRLPSEIKGENNKVALPGLVNPVFNGIKEGERPGPEDYRQLSSSPTVNAGAKTTSHDFFGTERDETPDVGFHELPKDEQKPIKEPSKDPVLERLDILISTLSSIDRKIDSIIQPKQGKVLDDGWGWGMNLAWADYEGKKYYGIDLCNDNKPDDAFKKYVDRVTNDLRSESFKFLRWWLWCDGRNLDMDGGLSLRQGTASRIKYVLDKCEEADIDLVLCLWNHDLVKEVHTRALIEDEAQTKGMIANLLTPLLSEIGSHPALIIDVMNEPEGGANDVKGFPFSHLQPGLPKADIQRFVALQVGHIKKHYPSSHVTVGNHTLKTLDWWSDKELQKYHPDARLSSFWPHWYEEWNTREWANPMELDVSKWKRPVYLGETSYKTTAEDVQKLKQMGWAGMLGWTYTRNDRFGGWEDFKDLRRNTLLLE